MAKENRIGSMTKSRGGWGDISPVTKIVKDKKKENDRKKAKRELQQLRMENVKC